MAVAEFRFYEELNDFLPVERRKCRFVYCCAEHATVKHAIEALGVPHTEVEIVLAQGVFSNPQHGSHIKRLKLRIDANKIALLDRVGEIHRLAVSEHDFHLGMGHTECLDGVLNGGALGATVDKPALSPFNRKKVVQFFVEAKLCNGHRF